MLCIRCKRTKGVNVEMSATEQKSFIDEKTGVKVRNKKWKCNCCGSERETTT